MVNHGAALKAWQLMELIMLEQGIICIHALMALNTLSCAETLEKNCVLRQKELQAIIIIPKEYAE